MQRQEIEQKVREIVEDHMEHHQRVIGGHDTLAEDLGMDSLDRVSMVMDLEDAFQVRIADDELAQALTFGDVLALVGRKLAACCS